MATESDKQHRAVGYERTSSEGQRDNTSIPRQQADNKRFIASQQGWQFIRHYVDESMTGSKVEGREAFQQMRRDAATGQFDVIVAWDITQFARDGVDIMSNAKFLKTTFGVDVVDSKGQFDTRDHHRVLTNFVLAGVAEDERLRIMERCIRGRIQRAKEGLPWGGMLPAGRGFEKTGKYSGRWFINDEGEKLRELLTRYADSEPLKALAREYRLASRRTITRNIHESQLSGPFVAKFHSPEIGIENLRVPIPGIPEVITPELEQRVKARMAHNKKWNKQDKQKYLLTGFVQCPHCGRSLHGQTVEGKYVYYRHAYKHGEKRGCSYYSIPGDPLNSHVMDYLYSFFLDEPAYNKAVKAALPSANDREALVKDIKSSERRLTGNGKEIANLVNAIAGGADVGLLLDKQDQLKTEKRTLQTRLAELQQTLGTMPDHERIEQEAMLLRLHLVQEHTGKDWWKLPYEDVRRFLRFLFGDDPKAKGHGIFVAYEKDRWQITFKGCVEFYHDVVGGRPVSHALQMEADTINRQLRRDYEEAVRQANKDYGKVMGELGLGEDIIKPDNGLKRTCADKATGWVRSFSWTGRPG